MTDTWELSSVTYYADRLDPARTMDPAERDRLARERYAAAVREAERYVTEIPATIPDPGDWGWDAVLQRVKAAAEVRSRTTGTTVPAGIILTAAQLVDLLLEGAAQANVRDTDLAEQMNLPAVALAATGTAWSVADERALE